MKKIILAGAIAFSLASCGGTSTDTTTPSTDSSSSTIQSGAAKGNSNLDNPGAASTMDAQGNSVPDSMRTSVDTSTRTSMDTTKRKN